MSDSSNNPRTTEGSPGIPPRGPETPTKIYKGGCHCGKYEFELRHPILEDGFEVLTCNCSICSQRGYLLIFTLDPNNDFKLKKGTRAELSEYRFNSCVVQHKFCPVCGCGIFEEVDLPHFSLVGVNARSIPSLDLDSLTLKKVDGRSMDRPGL